MHSSVDEHLCDFQFLAIRNNASYVYIYGCMCIYLAVELLGHMITRGHMIRSKVRSSGCALLEQL